MDKKQLSLVPYGAPRSVEETEAALWAAMCKVLDSPRNKPEAFRAFVNALEDAKKAVC